MKALASLALVFILGSSTFAQGAQPQRPDDSLSSEQAREEDAYAVGLQAYLWGFPLHFYGKLMPTARRLTLVVSVMPSYSVVFNCDHPRPESGLRRCHIASDV